MATNVPERSKPQLDSTTLAMMFADARLPVGGHVTSSGLEPALRAGLTKRLVPDYMLSRAGSVSLVEAGVAVMARRIALSCDGLALSRELETLEEAWAARTPSQELRNVSRSLARGYLRLAGHLWPDDHAIALCNSKARNTSRSVAIGVIAAVAGLDAQSLVRLSVYDDAQTIASAMLKLEPLDPTITIGWVMDSCLSVEPVVGSLSQISNIDAIPASGAPQIEEWAELHSLTTKRLFRA